MKSLAICLMGLVIFIQSDATQQPTVSGHVRLSGGLPVAGAQVMLFDLADLRRGAVAQATTDAAGQFALPLAALGGAFVRPDGFVLGANYPNPFNPATIIPYELAATSPVKLEVFNTLGQRIATLVDGNQEAGAHQAQWNGTDEAGQAAAAGLYFYRLTVDGVPQTGRMVLVDGQAGVPMGGASIGAQPLAESPGAAYGTYGLVVSGPGMVAYVDAEFGVEAGMGPVDIAVEARQGARMQEPQSGILGDVDNNGQVDIADGLLVAAYSINPATALPNNGDIARGDVNGDNQTDITDAWLLATYKGDLAALGLLPGAAKVGSAVSDREALVALYNATNGAQWKNNTNWLSDEPLSEWYGVTTDADGRVQGLVLERNQLSGSIPSELGNLTNLQGLSLVGNQLSGSIPAELGSLTNLQWLYLGGNQLSGNIPAALGSLTNLEGLSLYTNQLSGSIPAELGSLTNLQWLDLEENQLSGSIPAALGSLTNLELLYLEENQLSGSIPAALGSLTNLERLYLEENQLSGSIPAALGNLTNLQWLDLYGNQLSGSIPAALGNLTNLQWLDLYGNQLSGSIPATLGNLANLEGLSLGENQLSGSIPAALGNLTNLERLDLYGNQLSGSIPAELGNLTNLTSLYLYGNQLSGCIPASLQYTSNNDLSSLELDDCQPGTSPHADREVLVALYNATNGAQWKNNTNWLSDELHNEWYGVATYPDGRVKVLYLEGNQLSGSIPAALGNLTNLERLSLGGNQLSGSIPAALGNLTNLQYLSLEGNQLSGCIPAALRDIPDNDLSLAWAR